ncbi:MAG: PTS sugar transporter subunit IIC [Gemmatimonadota bacterium]|nr:MAG: PTS sugar transporter subunit IIC [Gemmatimonadota bacterium]
MWTDLLIVSLVGGVVAVDTTAAWQVMICRPIVSGPVVGLLLGDLQTGLFMGALMELLCAGAVPVRAAVFPDSNVASAVAVAMAVKFQPHANIPHFVILISILYSVPVAFIGSKLIVFMRTINSTLMERALKFAREGKARGVELQNWLGVIHSFGRGFVYSGVTLLLGLMGLTKMAGFSLLFGPEFGEISTLSLMALGGAVVLTIFGSKKTVSFIAVGFIGGILISIL